MDWLKVLFETFNVSSSTIIQMVYIIFPILILIEVLKDTGWLEKITSKSSSVTKVLRLPRESALGIIVGLFVGLLLGSGVIIQMREEVKMSRMQLNILFIFIGICHSIIEETVIFTAIGAYGWVIVINRIVMALIFTFAYIGAVNWKDRIKSKNKAGQVEI